MKVYGSMDGGWMERKHLAPYADYLIRFLEAYRAAGVPIQAICTQNEVETDQHGMMPACIWTPGMEAEFVRDHLGPGVRAREAPCVVERIDQLEAGDGQSGRNGVAERLVVPRKLGNASGGKGP